MRLLHPTVLALTLATGCSDSARFFGGEPDAGADVRPSGPVDAASSPSDASAPFVPPKLEVICTVKPCAVGLSIESEGRAFCALLDDGRVACWGQEDGSGVLGRPEIDGGPFVGIGLPAFVKDVAGAMAIESTCALLADHTVQCWGSGSGKLPFSGVTKLSKGYANRCAVVGPRAWSCIEGVYAPGPDGGAEGRYPQRAFALPSGAPLRQVFVGNIAMSEVSGAMTSATLTFLVREDGALLSSGARTFLGRETSLFPVDPDFDEVLLSSVTDIDVRDSACAIANGNVYCWGRKDDSIVYPRHALPLPIQFPEPAVRVSAVGFPAADATPPEPAVRRLCVIGASGAVYCTGPNSSGQVGDGTRATAYVPVRVEGLSEPAVQIAAAPRSTCALVASGKIHCWGSGVAGALGSGFAQDALTPTLVNLP